MSGSKVRFGSGVIAASTARTKVRLWDESVTTRRRASCASVDISTASRASRACSVFDTAGWLISIAAAISPTEQPSGRESRCNNTLRCFYARSGYPVPYYTGQLSFSATKLERYFATMQDRGTLDVCVRTQVVDFAFIAATAFLFVSSLLLVARAFAPRHPGRRIVTALVPLALVAPVFDSLENLCSFVMVANPTSISSPLALVYSTMAAIKFAGFAAVYGIAAVGLVDAALSRRRLAPVPAL